MPVPRSLASPTGVGHTAKILIYKGLAIAENPLDPGEPSRFFAEYAQQKAPPLGGADCAGGPASEAGRLLTEGDPPAPAVLSRRGGARKQGAAS